MSSQQKEIPEWSAKRFNQALYEVMMDRKRGEVVIMDKFNDVTPERIMRTISFSAGKTLAIRFETGWRTHEEVCRVIRESLDRGALEAVESSKPPFVPLYL